VNEYTSDRPLLASPLPTHQIPKKQPNKEKNQMNNFNPLTSYKDFTLAIAFHTQSDRYS
jgi:hypothetical protein